MSATVSHVHGRRTPEVHVSDVLHGTTRRRVFITCPLCGRRHEHGLPYGVTPEDHVSTRVRHCDGRALRRLPPDAPTFYRLVYPPGLGTAGVTA